MDMIGYSTTSSDRLHKERLMGLASVLEASLNQEPPQYEQTVNTATMIKDMVEKGAVLTSGDKVRLVRCLALAKAKVYAGGRADAYRLYKRLDDISIELIQLL